MDVKHIAAEGNAAWEKNIIRLKTGGDIYNGLKYAHEKVTDLEVTLSELKKQGLNISAPIHVQAISILQEELAKAKNQLAALVRRKWLSEEDYLRTLEQERDKP